VVLCFGVVLFGLFFLVGCGASVVFALAVGVLGFGAEMGFALDGDADRIQMVDARGNLYDGDQLLFAIVRSRARLAPVKGVAGTLMTNLALEHALARMGVPFGRAAVGDRYVVEMLNEKGWLYGGENSGHILALDRHTTGDGTVAGLQVLAALREAGGGLQGLLGELVLYPQKLINVPMSKGFPWQSDTRIADGLALVEARMNGRGRVLLRASGTEPLLRVMVEGEEASEVGAVAEQLATIVRQAVEQS
jgi:phosphoglucosamine mutase